MFFCDERHVSFDDSECTYKFYKENLMSKVPLSEDHIFPDDPSVSGMGHLLLVRMCIV